MPDRAEREQRYVEAIFDEPLPEYRTQEAEDVARAVMAVADAEVEQLTKDALVRSAEAEAEVARLTRLLEQRTAALTRTIDAKNAAEAKVTRVEAALARVESLAQATSCRAPDVETRCPSFYPYDEGLQCGRKAHDDDQCCFGGIAWKRGEPPMLTDRERADVAERQVARVEALADEWERVGIHDRAAKRASTKLRAALRGAL